MIKSYLTLTFLLFIDLLLYLFKGISLAGQFSDKALFWFWLIMSIFLVVKHIREKWMKYYLGGLICCLALSLLPMGIPFLMLTNFATNLAYEKSIDEYRLRDAQDILLPHPIIKVIKNKGPFEIELNSMDFGENVPAYYSLKEVEELRLIQNKSAVVFEFVIDNQTIRRASGEHRTWSGIWNDGTTE